MIRSLVPPLLVMAIVTVAVHHVMVLGAMVNDRKLGSCWDLFVLSLCQCGRFHLLVLLPVLVAVMQLFGVVHVAVLDLLVLRLAMLALLVRWLLVSLLLIVGVL